VREPSALWILPVVAFALGGCGDDDAGTVAPPRETLVVQEARAAMAEASPAPADSCARDLAERTPAPVRATLGELGYDAVFSDACLAQEAERQGDASVCEGLSVSTLRERCVSRVAIASGSPSQCPEARTMSGHDPLCVALAGRDRRLCGVLSVGVDRAVCEAALGREAACNRMHDADRDACVTRSSELASHVHGEVRTTPALETSLTMTAEGRTRAPSSADRGVRIAARGCTRRLLLGDAAHLTAPFGLASIAFELVLTREGPSEIGLSSLPSDAASTLAVSLDGARTLRANGGSVSLTRLETELGGRVEGTFRATFAGEPSVIDGSFTTFVRDLDPLPSACE